MDDISMDSENIKISESYVLTRKFTHKLHLRRGKESIALSSVSNYFT